MFCQNCGAEMQGKFCGKCGWTAQPQVEVVQHIQTSGKKEKKKDSVLSIVSCVLTFVSSFIFPMLSIGGIICGLIDLCMNDKSKRHLGSWFGIILGVLVIVAYEAWLKDIARNPMQLFR